jgi:hypothetical protein
VEKRLPLDLTHMERLVPGALARVGGDSRIGTAEAKRAGKALSRWKGLILAGTGASGDSGQVRPASRCSTQHERAGMAQCIAEREWLDRPESVVWMRCR